MNTRATGPDTRIYRTELCRNPDDGWSLYRDGKLLGRIIPDEVQRLLNYPEYFPTKIATAQSWAAEFVLGYDVTWLNGRADPDEESGYWVAEAAGEDPSLRGLSWRMS
jgi:hypothetical protein